MPRTNQEIPWNILKDIIFINLKVILADLRLEWRRRKYGTDVGASVRGERLTHVAFADDMTLVAKSWLSMRRMLSMLRQALALRGLTLHPSKCKLQTNQEDWQSRGSICIDDGFAVEVLDHDTGLILLGTVLSLTDVTLKEIDYRIAMGWKMFWSLKRSLLNRRVSINRRLQLFDKTVGSCVTWCCESWCPRASELRRLEAARRSMLRKIGCVGRAPTEDWLDWMKRATHKVLDWAGHAGVRHWGDFHNQRKWLWAGHVARRGCDTWLYRVTSWRDSAWQRLAMEVGGARDLRPSRRRWMKWEDPLRRFCNAHGLPDWMELAKDREQWSKLEAVFCEWRE